MEANTKTVAAHRALVDAALSASEAARLLFNARTLHGGGVARDKPASIKRIVDMGLREYVRVIFDQQVHAEPQNVAGEPFTGKALAAFEESVAKMRYAQALVAAYNADGGRRSIMSDDLEINEAMEHLHNSVKEMDRSVQVVLGNHSYSPRSDPSKAMLDMMAQSIRNLARVVSLMRDRDS